MAGTTAPAVIDALLTRWATLTIAYPTAAATPDALALTDGWPGTYQPQLIVAVGGTPEYTADGKQEWAGLGAFRKWERYSVHCLATAWLGGDGGTPEATSDMQKAARDMAFAAVHAVEANVLADPTLGGQFPLGGWAAVEDVQEKQTDDTDAAQGRSASVMFTVAVKARI